MKIKKLLFKGLVPLLGIPLFFGLSIAGLAQIPPIKPPLIPLISQIEVVFEINLDELAKTLPEKLMLYRAAPDPIGIAQRQNLEHFFGTAAYFEVAEVSGGVFCADLSRLWAKAPRPGDRIRTLDSKEIRAAAEKFLSEIKAPTPSEQLQIYTATDTMEFMDNRGQRQVLPIGFSMTYRRLLGGCEVVGPGGKIKVFLDLNGQVAGYLRVWRALTPLREERLIGVYQAADNFKKDPLGNLLLANVRKVRVIGLKVGYFELGMYESQRYLQPIYVFQCVAYLEANGQTWEVPYTRYMEALPQPPEPLWPTGPAYEPGTRPTTMPKPGED